MTREDAFYYKHLLILGITDGYYEWLDDCLKTEEPLSDITLELSYCGSDVNKAISLLHNFCLEQPFDDSVVYKKFLSFFKEEYYSKRMSKEEISSTMYRLVSNIGSPWDLDYNLWGNMYCVDDYLSLAKEGIISGERFDSAFLSFLNNNTQLDSNTIFKNTCESKPSLFERIKKLFKRK